MRPVLLPATPGDNPRDEAACRRLMSWLFNEKAEAVGTLLLHSAQPDAARSGADMPDAEFRDFLANAYRRADAIREGGLGKVNRPRSRIYFTNGPLTWGMAAAALVALFILVRGVFDILAPRGDDATPSGLNPSYRTASDSTRIATIRPASPASEQASPKAPAAAHPVQIAVPSFAAVSTQDPDIGRKIAQTVSANLGRSGLFTVIDATSSADTPSPVDNVPALSGWRQIGAQALLTGRVIEFPDRLEITVALWDVSAGKQLLEQRYTTRPESFWTAADQISGAINAKFMGGEGK
jgi:TolB-like protein